jgi:hypothetical protein
MPVGGLTLAIAELKGASYRQEQDMALAEVRGTFAKGEVAVQTRSFVDAGSNLLVMGSDVCRDQAGDGRLFAEKWPGRALGHHPCDASRRDFVLYTEERGCASRKTDGHRGGEPHHWRRARG